MNNNNINNSANITPQRQNQMTTPFGYNNNINLNSPLNSSTTNNSSNLNYSSNFLNMNFNQNNSNNSSNQKQVQQQNYKAPQVYMNPNISNLTGLSQMNVKQRDSQNNKDISLKNEKNQNEENLNDLNIFNNKQINNLNFINNNAQFAQGDMYMGGLPGNQFLQKNFAPMSYGMNNIQMQLYEQQSPQMFQSNNNNLNYSFQLNEEMLNNHINKKLKKNNTNLNLNKGQISYDLSNTEVEKQLTQLSKYQKFIE